MGISKSKIAGVVVLLGILVAAYQYYDFYVNRLPVMHSQVQAFEAALARKQNELRRLQKFAQNIDKIKAELRELNVTLESVLEHMPRTFDLSALLRKLTVLGKNSGVSIVDFKPAQKEERPGNSFYAKSEIGFQLNGSFTQIMVFIDQVSRIKRLTNLENIKFSVESVQRATASRDTPILARATITAFRFVE